MQMYLWTAPTPDRDGDLDADIVWHEYGHGLTWRIIDNMYGLQAGAIGEGASDTLAIIRFDQDTVGEYSYANPDGIRTAPYDTYFEDTGRTYEDFVNQVHQDGEIYAAIMWDMWTRYRDDATGAIPADDDDARSAIMDDLIAGMMLTDRTYAPISGQVTFPDMRDGILEAISGDNNPLAAPTDAALTRWCHTWEAFARYGVGVNQSTTAEIVFGFFLQWTWYEDFTVPAVCNGGTGEPPPGANQPPTSDFDWDETTAVVSQEINLDGTLSSDPDDDSLTYTWSLLSWPGGPRSEPAFVPNGATATLTPQKKGDHVVSLTVSDGNGRTDSITKTIAVADSGSDGGDGGDGGGKPCNPNSPKCTA